MDSLRDLADASSFGAEVDGAIEIERSARPADRRSALACSGLSLHGALNDEVTLELRDRPDDREHRAADRCGRVEVLRVARKSQPRVKLLECRDEVADRAGELVEAVDEHRVDLSLPHGVHEAIELGSRRPGARDPDVDEALHDRESSALRELREAVPRRAIKVDELRALLTSLSDPPARYRLLWRERRALYLLAFVTSLRRRALRELKWSDVDLERGVLTRRVATAKNRRMKVYSLPTATVAALSELRETAGDVELVFPHYRRTKTFREDLARAGVKRVTVEGKLDMHALARTSSATALEGPNVPITTTQKHLDHASVTTTASHYVRTPAAEERRAAEILEAFALGAAPEAAAPAAGTLAGNSGRNDADSRGYDGEVTSEDPDSPEAQRANPEEVGSWTDPDLNRGHQDFQSCALPTELSVQQSDAEF